MELKKEIKELIIKSLDLEDITVDDIKDDEPLFNDGLCLDSIDALEIGNFYSVNTLADYVGSKING